MCSHHTAMETLNLIMNSQGLQICRPAGRHRPPNRAVSVVCSMGTGLLWANQRARTHAEELARHLFSYRDPGGTVRTEDGTGQLSFFSFSSLQVKSASYTPAPAFAAVLLWRILWLCPLYREPTASCGLHCLCRRADKYI